MMLKLAAGPIVRQIPPMALVTERAEHSPEIFPEVDSWARSNVEQWCAICDAFKDDTLARYREIGSEAAPRAEHRQKLKVLLRMTRLLHAEIADPDVTDPALGSELEIRLRQLQDLWQLVHQPFDSHESDRILHLAFPQ